MPTAFERVIVGAHRGRMSDADGDNLAHALRRQVRGGQRGERAPIVSDDKRLVRSESRDQRYRVLTEEDGFIAVVGRSATRRISAHKRSLAAEAGVRQDGQQIAI